ncbi:RNA-binding protein asd-2 [Aphelenchoides bicaudatus]|nr:RNA-binding protein asd-2 [Aphelenchoides bicaudatus]
MEQLLETHSLPNLPTTPSTSPSFANENLLNGSGSSSSSTNGAVNTIQTVSLASDLNKPPDNVDYLSQLIKDKKQLAAFPNVFQHLERLLDNEINRVRVTIFQCEFATEPLVLPDAIGEIITRQEKVFVPTKEYPEYNFVGRILGPRGMTAKQLETETGCKIMVRGKGSMRDKKKEDANRGKPNWEHLNEELHVLIQCEDTPNRTEVKIRRAKDEVNKLLVPSPEGEDELKKKQLMELAIINGTYRNGSQSQSQIQLALAAASNASSALRGSPALTSRIIGNPLIMQQQQRVSTDSSVAAANPALLAALQLQQLNGAQAYPQILQQLGGAATPDYQQQLLLGMQYTDPTQLAMLQQQQLLLQAANPGVVLGEYKYDANQHGPLLASGGGAQRRFLGQQRAEVSPYSAVKRD